MATTPGYGFHYPTLGDAPNVPQWVQDLAEDVEATLTSVTPVTDKFATGGTVGVTQDTAGTTTSSTYVESLTGGTPCSFAFVAPPSGKVLVLNSGFVDNSSTGRSHQSWIIRTGSTIGSGTTFLNAGDEKSLANLGPDDVTATRTTLVTGLTPGASYNIRQQFKTSSGTTGNFQWKELVVMPVFF